MRSFIRRNLDPADRLGEVLFGLIMALGFTGAVRLEYDEPNNRALFIGIFGCNLAWAIVDGVMYVMTSMFERGRRAMLTRRVLAATSDDQAMQLIGRELDERIEAYTTDDERNQIVRWALNGVRREGAPPSGSNLRSEDILGAVAIAMLIVVSTFPVVLPYLIVRNPNHAVRISHWIALAELFALGLWWGRAVGSNPLKLAIGMTLIGAVLVLITILLGG